MENKKFLPIILGSDENAYGNARLFVEQYNIRPLLICTARLIPTLNSRLFDIIEIKGFNSDEIFRCELLKILKEKKEIYENIVVVPCSDYYTHLLSKYASDFEEYINNKFVKYELLSKLDTKDEFYRLCDKYGIDYPKTMIVSPEERETALDNSDFSYPIVVKPENSNATEYLKCKFEGKKKVFFFDTIEEYDTIIKNMKSSGYFGKLIIQEFIPGGDDSMRVVNTYSGNDGKTRVASLGQPVLEEYSPSSLGNYAAIISRSDEELCKKVASFLDELGYVGFANFDMKYDSRSGKYMAFEINCRPGRSSFYVRGAGLNLMAAMVEDAVFGKVQEELVCTDKTALWTAVPRIVLKKYVKNKALKKEILSLWKKKALSRTLFCREDMSLKRMIRINRYFYSYCKNYAKYYFDKEKEQQPK
ncbi:MAG: ATP-grasp domain-containing protein [Clostridia bacterium]|nr:ATP-grasp domain-containing protein [Clostridia bacterium]